jgi:hypothetical protein
MKPARATFRFIGELFVVRSPPKLFLPIVAFALCASLSSCSRLLLDERFNDNSLRGWSVIDDPDSVEIPSDWRVGSDGWLHQRSNIWGRRGDFIGRWYGTMIVTGSPSWTDYRLSLKSKPSDDDGFGVMIRFKDPEHFYRLLFVQDAFSGGPITRLDKREGADYTELWSLPRGYKVGAEMFIEVEVRGDVIAGSVDRQRLFEIRDGSYRNGKIGLFCYAQSDQRFDDVKVEAR